MSAAAVYEAISAGGYKWVKSSNQISQFLRSAHDAGAGVMKRKMKYLPGTLSNGGANMSEWLMNDRAAYEAWIVSRGLARKVPAKRLGDSEPGSPVVAGD